MKKICLVCAFLGALAFLMGSCATGPCNCNGKQFASLPFSQTFTVDKTYGNHMVLQRNMPICITGTCTPGEKVKVTLSRENAHRPLVACAAGNENGDWEVHFASLPASNIPYTMTISGADAEQSIQFTDILVGEVWICSGQSNMEMPVYSTSPFWRDQDYEVLLSEASSYPQIRIFNASPTKYASLEILQRQPRGEWQVGDGESIKSFSAVGYQFGRQLTNDLGGIPVGLISVSWSGMYIEPWISLSTYQKSNRTQELERLAILDMNDEEIAELQKKDREKLETQKTEWLERFESLAPRGTAEKCADWKNPGYSDDLWGDIANPYLDFPTNMDGAAWYRKTLEIPETWVGKKLTLFLGAIDDCDWTYVNGTEVGHTLIDVAKYWEAPRNYTIPADLVTSQTLTIAIRMIDLLSEGGFKNPQHDMYISLADEPNNKISLYNDWKFQLEFTADVGKLGPQPTGARQLNRNREDAVHPTVLFNSMIHPWIHYPVRGAIWYQGCANAGAPGDYYELQQLLVKSWRDAWNNPDFAFIVTQLAGYGNHTPNNRGDEDAWKLALPGSSNYGALRESQWYAARELPKTGMAVTLDIGDQYDIHPHNKRDVGYRLAREAMRICFGGPNDSKGPILKKVTFNNHLAILDFENTCGGLVVKSTPDDAPGAFVVADENGIFHHAKAIVNGNQIIVWSPDVKQPTAVRYGWVSYSPETNLYNGAGFPAPPFRTDLPDYIQHPVFGR